MEFLKMKQSLDVIEEQNMAVKDKSDDDKMTAKEVGQTWKKKSYKLRFNTSTNGSNPLDNNQYSQHKRQLPLPINERRPGIRKTSTESHCWKLEYKPYNKYEVLEKLKQEIYEKNVQRELELQIKSRIGFRSGDSKSASMMPRIVPGVTSVKYFKKRDEVPKELHAVDHERKEDIEQGILAPEIKDIRVTSSTRVRAKAIPKKKNRVTVGGMSTSTYELAQEGNEGVATFLSHLENHENQETTKSQHKNPEETLKDIEKRIEKNLCIDATHASTRSAWVDTVVRHHHPTDTRVPTNEILEKYFSSNTFPPLSVKSKHEDKEHGQDFDNSTSPLKCWTKPEQITPTAKSEDTTLTKKNLAAWKTESNTLRTKIKAFIEKPVPEISPSSLLIHRRSTVADISMSGFSKSGSTNAHAPAPDRKKSIGVVNIHTCPNVNVFTDRSWMYQDRRAEKCRYIRAPQTPIPPITEVFHPNEN